MADDSLITELAQVIHAALSDGQAVGMGTDLRAARAVLAWLAERGRLIPDAMSWPSTRRWVALR